MSGQCDAAAAVRSVFSLNKTMAAPEVLFAGFGGEENVSPARNRAVFVGTVARCTDAGFLSHNTTLLVNKSATCFGHC